MSAAPVRVRCASILFEYTDGASELEAQGGDVGAVIDDLERRHPGLRFRIVDEQDRIRTHIKVYVAGRLVRGLDAKVAAGQDVHILQALSGG